MQVVGEEKKKKRTSFLGDCSACVWIMILGKETVKIWITSSFHYPSVMTLFPVGLRAQVSCLTCTVPLASPVRAEGLEHRAGASCGATSLGLAFHREPSWLELV